MVVNSFFELIYLFINYAWFIVGLKRIKKCRPSGYEMCLKRLCNLVKSWVLADISIKIGEMVFRTFVHFFELFGGVFPQLFPNYF